jgi:hypothetical protein
MLDSLKKKLKEEGILCLKLKIKNNSQKTLFKEIMDDGVIKVELKSLPIENKANKELIDFLSKEFKVNREFIKIISGKTSKNKLIKITL